MIKPIILFISIVLFPVLFSCSAENVWVSIELGSIDNVRGVSFQKNIGVIHFIDKKDFDLPEHGEFISASVNVEHTFESTGEDTCTVRVLTKSDTICSEFYVEKGSRVKLNFENDTLSVVQYF